MRRVAIIAAMAGELKPLVRGWQHEHRGEVALWRTRRADAEWVAACAGAGQEAATRAFAEIEKEGPISRVISVGWAGALGESLVCGRAYAVSGVIDMRTGERFAAEAAGNSVDGAPRSQDRDLGHPGMWLVTSPRVADVAEKKRIAAAYDAGMVDMEAAAVARLAAIRGISFMCVKGVSDGFRENLPDFNRFISPQGKLEMSRLLFFVLPRIWHWPALIRMGENSKQASQAIRELLLENLDEPGAVANQNGDSNLSR
jgi:adenosylhomocysteine nucleosidase